MPATQKVVSIFEPHTDIIRKDRRDTLYGHKVFLTGGASGLIVDCFVERGNPADSTKAAKLAQRAIKVLGNQPSRSSSMEASARATTWSRSKRSAFETSRSARRLGCRSRRWSDAPGSIRACGTSGPASRASSRSSSGASAGIAACGAPTSRFRAYTWGSVIAANLVLLARHAIR